MNWTGYWKIASQYNAFIAFSCVGHGGGWGYSGHSIEAIRFMCDTDVLIGGFGLFGGRGEYFGKIKVNFTKQQLILDSQISEVLVLLSLTKYSII